MDVQDLVSLVDPENFWTSPEDMAAHTTWPAWNGGACPPPLAVARPASLAQAAQLLGACGKGRLPVGIRGAGTEFSVPPPVKPCVLVLTTGLRRLPDVDPVNRLVKVQAGVTCAELQKALAPSGLFCPGFSGDRATVGGTLAVNLLSQAAVKYGVPRLTELEILTLDGSRLRCPAQNSGPGDLSLAAAFCGSRGRLGLIGAATLRLLPLPAWREDYLITYENLDAAARSTFALCGAGPVPAEFFVFKGVGFPCDDEEEAVIWLTQVGCGSGADSCLRLLKESGRMALLEPAKVEQIQEARALLPARMAGQGFGHVAIQCLPADMPDMIKAISDMLQSSGLRWGVAGSPLVALLDVFVETRKSQGTPILEALRGRFIQDSGMAPGSPYAQALARVFDPNNLLGD